MFNNMFRGLPEYEAKIKSAVSVVALFVFSTQINAAVVFSNFSEVGITGFSEDISTAEESNYSSFTAVSLSTPSSIFNIATAGDATADSGAFVNIDVFQINPSTTLLTSNLSANAHASAPDSRTQSAAASADAYVDLEFTLEASYNFIFDVFLLQASDTADLSYGFYNVDSGDTIFEDFLVNGEDSFLSVGELLPGTYNLYFEAFSDVDGFNNEDFGFASAEFELLLVELPGIKTVPVPAAFWLFMSGLIGLGAVSRRTTKLA